MTDDDRAIYEHMLVQYRREVDQLKFNLARANAQNAAKDKIITDLRALIEEPPPTAAVPKPGPR